MDFIPHFYQIRTIIVVYNWKFYLYKKKKNWKSYLILFFMAILTQKKLYAFMAFIFFSLLFQSQMF